MNEKTLTKSETIFNYVCVEAIGPSTFNIISNKKTLIKNFSSSNMCGCARSFLDGMVLDVCGMDKENEQIFQNFEHKLFSPDNKLITFDDGFKIKELRQIGDNHLLLTLCNYNLFPKTCLTEAIIDKRDIQKSLAKTNYKNSRFKIVEYVKEQTIMNKN